MSGDLRPWIRDYLIRVAETYGGTLSSVPLEEKGKKAQISEFLTVGTENEDSVVWAFVHDKALVVPVKFSKDAVTVCNKNSISGLRLTNTKTCLVTMKKFRPMSTRIPCRNGGMTQESHLALLCESVSIVGSIGETKWGNPKELDTDPDLREWSHALRQDGGAGNILKERQKVREGNSNKSEPPKPAKGVISPHKPPPVVKPNLKASTSKSRDPLHEWRKLWHDTIQNPLAFARPSLPRDPSPVQDTRNLCSVRPSTPPRRASPVVEDARDLGSSSPSEKYSVTSSPLSGWEPTVAGSSPRKRMAEAESRSPTPSESSPKRAIQSSPCLPKESSYLTAPTPAQRRQWSQVPSHAPIARKVARPPPPPPPASGPARVLVPDSDTSQSQPSQPSQPIPSQLSQPAVLHPSEPSQSSGLQPVVLSQPSQPSQPPVILSQPVIWEDFQSVPQPAPRTLKDEDEDEHLSEDDADTDRQLFRRRGSPLERGRPAKKRRIVNEDDAGSAYRKLNGFNIGLDYIECGDSRVIGWDRVWAVLAAR
ncbi:hypothetical protein MVEN_00544500 [Mycena venus]|uniref:Telomere replication protein EST3 n=1 Tax=Mycena venus TaxID=2733690 RepID=A0A8H7D7T0_9AGAR|nr:hypothetical protein MVEN_00544500 [Mycena venus]